MEKIKDLVLTNIYWYLIPILLFNVFFAPKLTTVGYLVTPNDIGILKYVELVLRISIWALPLLIFVDYNNPKFKFYLIYFILGVLLYFASWLLIIYFPTSPVTLSWWIQLGPAYLPVIWLISLALMSKNGLWFMPVSVVFCIVHTVSTYLKLRG